ncbi:MAG TPA: hypothetical protein VG892_13210, partial [Terriglobales bacterium]|nr:hypothetical protein [Terriglobales bacterium]
MNSRQNNMLLRHFAAGFVAALMFACFSLSLLAQQSGRGTISGRVTADEGQVVAFRVSAHNLDR